ncbi:TRAP transporter substrate-binding protein [bacterium]|nr:TRAP transporter substrate-binding protein [bacterium]NDD11359.1 TRAP transporter substrate-binding protein [Betaproteobacteria bacterium]
MDRRGFIRTAGVAGAGAGVAGAPAVVAAQQPVKWKMQSMWSSAELTYKVFEDLCGRINKLCSGKLEITPFAAGAVTGPFETLDAVSAGVLQGHSSWPGYFSGKDPGLAVISDFVFGYTHPWQAEAWYYQKGGLDMLREAYAKFNVYPVGVSWWGVEAIVAKKPIRNMADFKGVKIRSPQGMTAEVLTKLGASIVVLPGGEVYSALDKGVVDAADWATISMNQRMGFHEVAKFPVIVGHSMPVQEFSVNMAAWKALPEDVKLTVSTAVREWTWDQIQRVAVDDVRVLIDLKKKGVNRIVWDDAEQGKIRDLAHKTWEDWSKKGPLAKRAYDSQLAWLKDLGLVA